MIARIRKSIDTKDKGFTLIELLVVMIIIGILAAIAIPLFLSQRKKAEDSAAKSDVSILGKEIATWFVDNTGAPDVSVNAAGEYVITVATVETKIGNVSNNVEFDDTVHTSDGTATVDSTNWCVFVTNEKGDKAVTGFQYSAEGGLEEGRCGVAATT